MKIQTITALHAGRRLTGQINPQSTVPLLLISFIQFHNRLRANTYPRCGEGGGDNLDCDNHDNGVYIIDGWDIVGRKYAPLHEQDYHQFRDVLEFINKSQPKATFER